MIIDPRYDKPYHSMKVDRLETHDRYQHFTKQEFDIGACCQDLINKRPFGDHAFYIFAHPRTDDDGFTKRLLWQARLTKPKPQTNSMLFKAYPGTDVVKLIWMLPAREMWDQYMEGKITENKTVSESVYMYNHKFEELSANEPDDLSDEQIRNIYREQLSQGKVKHGMDLS